MEIRCELSKSAGRPRHQNVPVCKGFEDHHDNIRRKSWQPLARLSSSSTTSVTETDILCYAVIPHLSCDLMRVGFPNLTGNVGCLPIDCSSFVLEVYVKVQNLSIFSLTKVSLCLCFNNYIPYQNVRITDQKISIHTFML